jgi:hypothetical protein
VPWLIAAVGLALIGAGAWLMQTGVLESLAFVGVLALVAMMLGAFLRPAVRGAGPPLIVALTVTLIAVGVLFMVGAALDTSSDDEPISVLEWAAASLLIAVFFIAGAGCAWWMLKRMARRYEARRFSDAQLALGAYWGLVTLFMLGFTMLFAFQDRAPAAAEWIGLAMLLLWALWRLALRLAMRWARHGSAPPLGSLLLLRVFKPSNRSEAFMDRFLARWRFAAPTWLIAGPDLAGAFMEPDEFFAYVGRQLERRFIRDDGTLAERLAALDARRDPDGRFRVAEMFCSNTMWKAAVQAMLDRAGVVLLDLREFTEKRAGTRYELCEILRRADFGRVLVLTDEAGDAPRLRAAIDAAWREAGHPRGGTLRVLRVEQGTDAEMNGLFRAVAAAAAVPT